MHAAQRRHFRRVPAYRAGGLYGTQHLTVNGGFRRVHRALLRACGVGGPQNF